MTVAANDGDLDEFQDDSQNDSEAHLGNEQPGDEVDLDPDAPDAELDDGEGVVVTIDGESPPPEEDDQSAPEWVREVRKASREKDKLIRELQKKVAEREAPAPTVILGPKPTLEGCEYDPDDFATKLEAWHERKLKVDAEQRTRQEQQAESERAWKARLANHSKLAAELKVQDFEDATAPLESVLSETQRGMIVHAADNSAVLLYALGKNPAKAKELASIADPVKFAFAVAKLESKLKVTPRKAAPIPERTVRGNASVSGAVDPKLARLEAEAEKTGDRTRVVAYKRDLKQRRQAA